MGHNEDSKAAEDNRHHGLTSLGQASFALGLEVEAEHLRRGGDEDAQDDDEDDGGAMPIDSLVALKTFDMDHKAWIREGLVGEHIYDHHRKTQLGPLVFCLGMSRAV